MDTEELVHPIVAVFTHNLRKMSSDTLNMDSEEAGHHVVMLRTAMQFVLNMATRPGEREHVDYIKWLHDELFTARHDCED